MKQIKFTCYYQRKLIYNKNHWYKLMNFIIYNGFLLQWKDCIIVEKNWLIDAALIINNHDD